MCATCGCSDDAGVRMTELHSHSPGDEHGHHAKHDHGDATHAHSHTHRHDAQPFALQARHDLADEAPLDGVRLADDEGAVAHRRRTLSTAFFADLRRLCRQRSAKTSAISWRSPAWPG